MREAGEGGMYARRGRGIRGACSVEPRAAGESGKGEPAEAQAGVAEELAARLLKTS
jgi:hypothetical protein